MLGLTVILGILTKHSATAGSHLASSATVEFANQGFAISPHHTIAAFDFAVPFIANAADADLTATVAAAELAAAGPTYLQMSHL